MKVTLCYHCVPHLKAEECREELAACRFLRTYVANPPGYPHRLVMNMWDLPGKDIAAHQRIAQDLVGHTDICVFMSAHVFFHRAGWLERLVETIEGCGVRDMVYGIMASCEASPGNPDIIPNPHLRTCLFACAPELLAKAPEINTPQDGFFFESQWLNKPQNASGRLVTWGTYWTDDAYRHTTHGFRQGDQSDLLAHDRHSLAYENATPEEKAMLNKIANGERV